MELDLGKHIPKNQPESKNKIRFGLGSYQLSEWILYLYSRKTETEARSKLKRNQTENRMGTQISII